MGANESNPLINGPYDDPGSTSSPAAIAAPMNAGPAGDVPSTSSLYRRRRRSTRSASPTCRRSPVPPTSIGCSAVAGVRARLVRSGNEFGRAPDVLNLFVSYGSVGNTRAAACAALTVVALALHQADLAEAQMNARQSCQRPTAVPGRPFSFA